MTSGSVPLNLRYRAAVLTISDSASRGERVDASGPAVRQVLEAKGFEVAGGEIVPDDRTSIENALIEWCDRVELVVTTGGTGLAERDVTPEATRSVCDRLVPGLPERMRLEGSKRTPFAALSRGICGVRNHALIVNLPGSPAGATESLGTVIDLLPHALNLLRGQTAHESGQGGRPA
ncbi:MAG: molybdenum cofactor biosynthesis protein B [Terriglobales bacterium]